MRPDSLAGQPVWVMAKGYAPDEGGMQSYAQGVAEAYARAGAEVTVFSQTSLGPRRERVGLVRLVDIGPGKSPLVPLRLMTAMRKERRAGPAPLFTHGTTWRTSLLPMLMGLPYVTTFHGREFMYGNRVVRATIRRVALRARALIAVSRHTGERLRERIGAGCPAPTIAWNGTSLAGVESQAGERLPAGEGPLLFSLCRLEPRKNVAACVRACAALRRRGLRFRYVIGGRGPELASIKALVAELGLEPCVTVAGYMEPAEAAAMHRAADIFLHPQVEVDHGRDFEGFGITIADAMACGTAPIVGKDGGSKELVEHGSSGLIVDGRSDEALEAALFQLLSDEPLRRAMAQRAQAFARANFTWERHIALILAALCPQAGKRAAGEAGWTQANTGSPG